MRRLAALVIVLSVYSVARADYCWPPAPISLYSGQPLDLRVFFDSAPAAATPLQLYTRDKLVKSAIADQNGWVQFVLLPDRKYRVVIPHKGTFDVVVLSRKSNLNGPLIFWYLFPTPKYTWVAGKKVANNQSSILVEKAD